MELRPTSVEQTLNSVVSNMIPWARQDQVKISVNCDEKLPQLVLADPNRLSQVVANFVSNGIKFVSKDGSGTVDVKAQVIAGPTKLTYSSTAETTTPTSLTEERIRFPFLHRTLARILQFGDALCECPYRAVDTGYRKLTGCLRRCRRGAASDAARAAEDFAAARDLERAEELPAPIGVAIGIPSFNSGAVPRLELGVTSRTAAAHRFSMSVYDGLRLETPDSTASKSHSRFGTPPVEPVTVLDSHATGTCPPVWVRIEVTDNGVGINDTDKQRLFKAFVQLDAGVRQKGKGTGLGLHICKEIMMRMGGCVGVDSTPGRGSTFFAGKLLVVLHCMRSYSCMPPSICHCRVSCASCGKVPHAFSTESCCHLNFRTGPNCRSRGVTHCFRCPASASLHDAVTPEDTSRG
jgi:signal transduction histidine kinase